MISLLLLFLSTVLSASLIFAIPFGLEKRQKKLIAVTAPAVGSLGLAFSLIVPHWQSLLVMVLMAVLAGCVIISRTTATLESDGAISRVMDTGDLSEFDIYHDLPKSIDEHENIDSALKEISLSNAVSSKEEDIRIAEDISFLEPRNNQEFELSELEIIPVLNLEALKEEVDDAAYET
ncbi:hypothetical protein G3A_20360 [Bacillus sp. 17376]|uniref:Uncharacterized protein n=1 Tax=Mesobacillus boroniphilus JCM 21738 TaxID=1294265 RepID=W4RI79_9BACI|nr:hypothetical protein [Mesobacillus boroniphilus]ESU30780.1 hypothetical protein G3A_20360 [Bacillus sp. 17376]GAE43971.1 hypothetical protein JCM21738_643 [Mesobacillus boroniphilus JCM 21738]